MGFFFADWIEQRSSKFHGGFPPDLERLLAREGKAPGQSRFSLVPLTASNRLSTLRRTTQRIIKMNAENRT